MAGEFGPLVAPGWPNLQGPDIAGAFLHAFTVGAANANRQRQLENQLAGMSLRAQIAENRHALDEDKFNLAVRNADFQHSLDTQKFGILQDYQNVREERAKAYVDNIETALKRKVDQDDAKEKIMGIGPQLTSEGFTPGTQAYLSEYQKRAAPISGSLPTSAWNAIQRDLHTNYNADALRYRRDFDAEERSLNHDIGAQIWNNPNKYDPTPLLFPDKFAATKTAPGSRSISNLWTGTQIPDTDAKGNINNIVVDAYNAAGTGTEQKTIPRSIWQPLQARIIAHNAARKQMGPLINDPSNGVSPNPVPQQSDIDYLRSHPEQSGRFENKFGAGTAQQFLQ